jgi:hypothetical protein
MKLQFSVTGDLDEMQGAAAPSWLTTAVRLLRCTFHCDDLDDVKASTKKEILKVRASLPMDSRYVQGVRNRLRWDWEGLYASVNGLTHV